MTYIHATHVTIPLIKFFVLKKTQLYTITLKTYTFVCDLCQVFSWPSCNIHSLFLEHSLLLPLANPYGPRICKSLLMYALAPFFFAWLTHLDPTSFKQANEQLFIFSKCIGSLLTFLHFNFY